MYQSLFVKEEWAYEFWRFVFVNQEVGKYAQTFLDFPPMQKGANFNVEALKEELEKNMQSRAAQAYSENGLSLAGARSLGGWLSSRRAPGARPFSMASEYAVGIVEFDCVVFGDDG